MKTVLALMAPLLFVPIAGKAACSLAQPPNMTLGIYTGTQSNAGTMNLTVNCTLFSANYTIGIDGGSSGSTANRTMKSGAVTLNYALFRDAARTQNWGNAAGTDTYAGNGGVTSVTIPVYPRVAAGQIVAPGTYVDTVRTGTRSFTVTATVAANCLISTTNLAFGSYAGTQLDASATVAVNCTNTTSYNVGLNAGTATGATVTSRKMNSGTALLNYALFSNAGRTTNWGSTPAQGVAGTGSGGNQQITVYGRVAAGQHAAPGAYSDAIIATVTY